MAQVQHLPRVCLTFVILPALMVSRVAFSRLWQKVLSSTLPNCFARKASPLVQAKMDATGFVEVRSPFWYCLQ